MTSSSYVEKIRPITKLFSWHNVAMNHKLRMYERIHVCMLGTESECVKQKKCLVGKFKISNRAQRSSCYSCRDCCFCFHVHVKLCFYVLTFDPVVK